LIYKCAKGNLSPQSISAVIVVQILGRFFSATRYYIEIVMLMVSHKPFISNTKNYWSKTLGCPYCFKAL